MKNILLGGATKRLVVLLALIGCLFYLRSPQRASAGSCQTTCEDNLIACTNSCNGLPDGEYILCRSGCLQLYNYCLNNCK
jgi:hypothetical protein